MISCNIYVDNQEIINYPIYEIIQKLDFIDYIFIYCGDQISYDIIQPLVNDPRITIEIINFKKTMQNKYQLDCGVCHDPKQTKMFHEVIDSLTSEGDVKSNIAIMQNYCTHAGGNSRIKTKQSKKSLRRI